MPAAWIDFLQDSAVGGWSQRACTAHAHCGSAKHEASMCGAALSACAGITVVELQLSLLGFGIQAEPLCNAMPRDCFICQHVGSLVVRTSCYRLAA